MDDGDISRELSRSNDSAGEENLAVSGAEIESIMPAKRPPDDMMDEKGEDVDEISLATMEMLGVNRTTRKDESKPKALSDWHELPLGMQPSADLFREMDKYFLGDMLPSLGVETFRYKATGLEMSKRLEVPIIIQSPNTILNYEFRAQPSTIKFGVTFIAALAEGETIDDIHLEQVEEMRLVNTSPRLGGGASYSYQGSFVVGDEGVVFLIFGVDDSAWFHSNVTLSYTVNVVQPTFEYVDKLRSENSLQLLEEVVEDIELTSCNYEDLSTSFDRTMSEMEVLEVKAFSLRKQLAKKKCEQEDLFEAMAVEVETIERGYEHMNGLCIRLLNRHLLSVIFSFLIEPKPEEAAAEGALAAAAAGDLEAKVTGVEHDHTAELALVSKYWMRISLSTRALGVEPRSVVPSGHPGAGPRWERGIELNLDKPLTASHLKKLDMVQEVATDLVPAENDESETHDEVLVVPPASIATPHDVLNGKVEERRGFSTADNAERQLRLLKNQAQIQQRDHKQRQKKNENTEQRLLRKKIAVPDVDSSGEISSSSSSSSSSAAREGEDEISGGTRSIEEEELESQKSPQQQPSPYSKGGLGIVVGDTVPSTLILSSGVVFDLTNVGPSQYSKLTRLASKMERVFQDKKELRVAIHRWNEAWAYQQNREPTVEDKRRNAVAHDLYKRYTRKREEARLCERKMAQIVSEHTDIAKNLKI